MTASLRPSLRGRYRHREAKADCRSPYSPHVTDTGGLLKGQAPIGKARRSKSTGPSKFICARWYCCRTVFARISGVHEKELRIALVCFGGVSLAVYMHGTTKEFLKLARASRTLHSIADRSKRASASFLDLHDSADTDTTPRRSISTCCETSDACSSCELSSISLQGPQRAGSTAPCSARLESRSADGAASRPLARQCRRHRVACPRCGARDWSKWFLQPFIWGRRNSAAGVSHQAISRFDQTFATRAFPLVQASARWHTMAELMYDASRRWARRAEPDPPCCPSGHSARPVRHRDRLLRLRQQLIQLHDPPSSTNTNTVTSCIFAYRRHAGGEIESDFELTNAPGLAFAARATSSYPGRVPPGAASSEMDKSFAHGWAILAPPRRPSSRRTFAQHQQTSVDTVIGPFIDGAVLEQPAFPEAITAIHGRPAYREVDRRVVYIDPNPAPAVAPTHRGMPGFSPTLKGALSDIPLAEPITEDLNWIARFERACASAQGYHRKRTPTHQPTRRRSDRSR